MLKKITFCFLAILLICMFTICAFAAQYHFELSPMLLELNDVLVDTYLWSDSFTCYYSFSTPLHDNTNGDDIVAAESVYDASSGSLLTQLYTSSGVYFPADTPDLESFGCIVTADTSDDIDYDQAVAMFTTVFGEYGYAGPVVNDSPVYTGIFAVFTQIITWIAAALLSVVALFWANGSLTFFGILTLVALGIALFFLLCGIISHFLRFRS